MAHYRNALHSANNLTWLLIFPFQVNSTTCRNPSCLIISVIKVATAGNLNPLFNEIIINHSNYYSLSDLFANCWFSIIGIEFFFSFRCISGSCKLRRAFVVEEVAILTTSIAIRHSRILFDFC